MRVLLVDDHVLFRRTLASFLSHAPGIEVVGEAGDGTEGATAARDLRPDLVLMDIRMPNCNGVEATRRIKGELPQVRIVALTVSEEMGDLVEIVRNGAEGYLLKNATPEELVTGLQRIMEGEVVLSPAVTARVFREFAQHLSGQVPPPSIATLSPREVEVLRIVAEGATNKEISTLLCLSESTVRNHVHNVLSKLHLHNRFQAAIYAKTHGLVQSGPMGTPEDPLP